jgi:hypothetical protein
MSRRRLIPQFELPNAFTLDIVPTQDGDRIAAEQAAEAEAERQREADRNRVRSLQQTMF